MIPRPRALGFYASPPQTPFSLAAGGQDSAPVEIFRPWHYNVLLMREGFLSSFIWAWALACIASFSLQASPLRDPKRSVNGQTVDLNPLFRWWAKHAGARPLTSWVHVTGSVIGTNAWGWTLEAHVESSKPRKNEASNPSDDGKLRIILQHPPAYEFAEFENLKAQIKSLDDQHNQLSARAAQAQARAQELADEQSASRARGLRARGLSQQEREWKQADNEAKDQLKTIDKQLQELRAKLAAYPDPAKYSVDTFALDLGQEYSGVPMYDHGFVWK